MTESKRTGPETNRRNALAALTGGSILGAFSSIFVGEARAQDGGAAAAQIGILIERFREFRKDFNETSTLFSNVRDTIKGFIDQYFEWTEDLWRLHDEINGLMISAPGLGSQIAQLPAEIVAHVKKRFGEVEALIKAYEETGKGKPNVRHGMAFRARTRLGRALGEASAKNLRERYTQLKKSVESNRSRKKSKGEIFREGAAPLDSEVNLLAYESLLRIEAKLERFLEMASGQEYYEPVKPLSKNDIQKSFDNLKKGKGTLLDDGE